MSVHDETWDRDREIRRDRDIAQVRSQYVVAQREALRASTHDTKGHESEGLPLQRVITDEELTALARGFGALRKEVESLAGTVSRMCSDMGEQTVYEEDAATGEVRVTHAAFPGVLGTGITRSRACTDFCDRLGQWLDEQREVGA